jgi:NADP-dependent 3-hydroxy acid dehydrogenase YdfG
MVAAMGQLEGQVAIVTGGGTGIGRETARRLAAEGARVVVAGRRKPPLDLVVGEIEAAGGQAVTTLRDRGIRATTIVPAEVDTPILDARPHPPDAKARATMMQSDDVARAILFCVTLPPRTVVEEIVMSPTMARDHSAEIATARRLGEPARR